MATKIVTKNSSTASAVPTASDLVQGELAVNVADKRLFTEDNGGSIIELGTNPSTIDINAGSIDGTAIGASSASTGAFTTLTASGLTVDTNTLYVDSTNNRVGIGTSSPSNDLHVSSTTGSAKLTSTGGGANLFMESADGNATRIRWNSNSNFTIRNDATSSDVFNINQSGNVGIGVVPESWTYFSPLQAKRSSFAGSDGQTGVGYNWYFDGAYKYIANDYALAYQQNATSGVHTWSTAASGTADNTISWSESMRIDASGNLLVGKTSSDLTTDGFEVRPTGFVGVRTNGDPLYLNRKSTDGAIVTFAKDGSTVGSIGASGGDLYIGTGDTALRFFDGADFIYPVSTATGTARDNAIDLGYSTGRFDDIYATNGTIQTSDRNEKQDIAELSDAEQRVAVACKGLLRKFRWKDSVAEKGDDARIHFGIIAQDLQAAFVAEGLDAGDYAMFISTTWTDEETNEEKTRMGVRYSELLAFIISAI